jgi:glutaredoxin
MVKRYLDSKQLPYTYINLDDEPQHVDEVVKKSGVFTVPVTIITKDDTERVVVGYNLSSLSSAIA